MAISTYSVIMAVLCSDIFIILLYILRKKRILTSYYGITLLTILYILTVFRMLFPLEFDFTIIINVPTIYNPLGSFLRHQLGTSGITVRMVFLLVWITGSAFFLIRYVYHYRKAFHTICNYELVTDPKVLSILEEVNRKYHKVTRITLRKTSHISVPMGIGLFQKTILLPDWEYDDTELFYIIAHECNHFYNHDLWVKIANQLFCCIFWWNPLVYLLHTDLENALEIKCDYTVSEDLLSNEKAAYIQTIIQGIKRALGNKTSEGELQSQSARLLNRGKHENTRERIELLTQDSSFKPPLLIRSLVMIVCLVFVLSSYCFILLPEYPAPDVDENGEPLLGSEDITIFKEADGTYTIHMDGTDIYIPISEEEAEFNLEGGAKLVEKER